MAEVMIALTVAQTGLALLGQRNSDKAQQSQAKSDAAAARYEADAMDQKAGQERAVSQFQAEQRQKEAQRLLSRQQALGAASGAGTGGSFATVQAKTAEKGQFNADLEMWQGETAARGLEQNAKLKRVGASQILATDKARRRTMPLQYASTIISGATKIAGIGADAGYWKPPANAGWTQTVSGPDGNVRLTEPIGSRYSFG